MSARLRVDRDVCIGAGMCVMADDTVFDQGEDGLVMLLVNETEDPDLAERPSVRRAVATCPSGALRLETAPAS